MGYYSARNDLMYRIQSLYISHTVSLHIAYSLSSHTVSLYIDLMSHTVSLYNDLMYRIQSLSISSRLTVMIYSLRKVPWNLTFDIHSQTSAFKAFCRLFYRALLQKRPVILRSLLIGRLSIELIFENLLEIALATI